MDFYIHSTNFKSRAAPLFMLFILTLAACASLPDYAKPRMGKTQTGALAEEGIQYRTLRVGDFQASSLEDDLYNHRNKLNAHTRIIIRPNKASQLRISRSKAFNQVVYHGTFDALGFEARMLPKSSWWNSKIPKEKISYVLQHEQIHFALMEIVARRMSEEVQRDTTLFSVFGSSYEEVQGVLGKKISEYIDKNIRLAMIQHTNFDKETSLFYDPMAQQKWYGEVRKELDLGGR